MRGSIPFSDDTIPLDPLKKDEACWSPQSMEGLMMDDPSLKHEPRAIAAGGMEGPRRKESCPRARRVFRRNSRPLAFHRTFHRAPHHTRSIDDDVSLMSLRFIDRLQTTQ